MARLSPRNLLYLKIDNSLSESDVKALRASIVKGELIGIARVEKATPHEMFNMLEADAKLPHGDLGLLASLLWGLNKWELAEEAENLARQERGESPPSRREEGGAYQPLRHETRGNNKRIKLEEYEVDCARAGSSHQPAPQMAFEGGGMERHIRGLRRIFMLIKEKLGVRWKDFARALNFEEPTIEVFEYKHTDPREACMDMLEEWRQREGRGATLDVLLRALEAVGRMDVADAVRDVDYEEEIQRPQCPAQMPRYPEQKRVFISYTLDPHTDPNRTARQRDAHITLQRDRVRALSDELRRNGVDCVIDQYVEHSPPNFWTRWTEDEMHMADYVLMICTPNYLQCVTGQRDEEASSEYKVRFEGKVIYAQLANPAIHDKFLPVFFDRIDRSDVPPVFQGGHFYGPIEKIPRYGQESFDQLFCKIVGSAPQDKLPPPVGNVPPGLVQMPRRI